MVVDFYLFEELFIDLFIAQSHMQKVTLTFLVMLLAPSKFAIDTSCLCNPFIFLRKKRILPSTVLIK